MTKKETVFYILSLLFFATLFSSDTQTLNGIVVGLLVIWSLTLSTLKEKWALLKERKYLLFMVLFFVMIGISLALSENRARGFRYLDTRLALFYFPVSVGLVQLRKEFKEKVLLGFGAVTVLACLFCLGWSIHQSDYFTRPELLYNDSLTAVLGRQSIYISLLVNLSIFSFGYWFFFKKISGNKKALLGFAVLFLYLISYLLASRNMMVVLYGATFCFAGYYIIKRKKYLEGAALVMGLLIGIFLIFKFFPKTLNRYRELTYTQFDYRSMGKESHYNMEVTPEQWNGANLRLAVWQCAFELFKQHPVLGVGLGDKLDSLMEVYKQKGFQFAVLTKRNVHSNYIDILYSMGAVGFALFLLGWVMLPFYYAWKSRDKLAMLIITTLAIAMVTEIYFDRTIGGMTVGFLIPFVLTDKRRDRPA